MAAFIVVCCICVWIPIQAAVLDQLVRRDRRAKADQIANAEWKRTGLGTIKEES